MTTNLTSLNETARLLRIPPMNLSRWVRVYRIPTVKIGNVLAMRPAQVETILISVGKMPAREDVVIS